MHRYDNGFTPAAPTTTITLINPNTKKTVKVKMLIDTGSDETVLPLSAFNSIDGGWLRKKRYVKNFSGEIAETIAYCSNIKYRAESFDERFYVTTQDKIGLLGRDIINEFKLQLDGPVHRWNII